MQHSKIKIAIIGTGHRAEVVMELLKQFREKVEIPVVYDPDYTRSEKYIKDLFLDGTIIARSYQEAIDYPGIEWVMVFSPNAFHCEHVLAAFQTGKHVFSEKPIATSVQDCKKIYDAYLASGKIFATGFVLRYAPLYRKVKELLDTGKFGSIMQIEANEHIPPYHGSHIMRNWRRHTDISGPHILEKCCHDLDLIIWYSQSLPSKVASFASRDFFVPSHKELEEKYPKLFEGWYDAHALKSSFTGDTDLMDNQIIIAEMRNGVKVSFNATMCNCIPERRMFFHCTAGSLKVDLYSHLIQYKLIGSHEIHTIDIAGDGHAGGDPFIMKELYETMSTGAKPKCSGCEGLESAVFALACDQAAATNQIVDVEPTWRSLQR